MHSYFYHLKFELYPTRDPTVRAKADTRGDIWMPSAHSTVFDDLPAHPQHRNDDDDDYNDSTWKEKDEESATGSFETTAVLRDWRFGRVSIDTIDPREAMATVEDAAAAAAAPSLGPSFSGPGTATKATCLRLNTHHTEAGWGVVHFYRDEHESTLVRPADEAEQPHAAEDAARSAVVQGEVDEEDCSTLCIPAVPAYMSPGDLWGFIGERWRGDISHCRMVMTSKMNRYLVLLKFRHGRVAREWKKTFDGKVFNTMEVRCREAEG